MSKLEYKLYVLGEFPTPAGKYKKVKEDITNETAKGMFRKNAKQLAMLNAVKRELEDENNYQELEWTTENEKIELVQRLAKRCAIELITQGKVIPETMMAMSSLDREDFVECVKISTKIASYLNHETQEAERSVKPQDVVPEEFMR